MLPALIALPLRDLGSNPGLCLEVFGTKSAKAYPSSRFSKSSIQLLGGFSGDFSDCGIKVLPAD